MPEIPSGTVTLLFTDIEGSTRLLHELGDAYADALAAHRRVLRQAFARHGGVEVDTQGDAFFVAFAHAEDALAAAASGQSKLTDGPVRVRMGLHTGRPLVTEEGYVGIDVHRAARIAAAGHGGQVLVSQTTRNMVEAELTDLGEHRLKDLAEPVWIFQLGRDEFPPLRSLSNTNLPIPSSPLVGREREVAELRSLVLSEDVRLVTLTGAGGSGKTRLALELGLGLLEAFPNGVFIVQLAPLTDTALVVPAIAQALGVRELAGRPLLSNLQEHLADKHLLLVVDNCEHLRGATPTLSALLAAAPKLTVLATSRECLHLSGEHDFPLAPLVQDEAVELFAARAKAVMPSFALDGIRVEVVEICNRLDCLPLAIELAAARMRVLSPQALLARLEQRLPLLTGGARDAPERQRTLRATIEWSYELLELGEQELFARLAVFAGGCTPEAAEDVCTASLDTFSSLIDKSLLRQSEDRLWMLETIREYALERLEEAGEAEGLRRRHAQYFLEVTRQAEGELRGAEQAASLETLEAEHDNLRAALAGRDGDLQLEFAGLLWRFWVARGHFEEGLKSLRQVLGRPSPDAALRAQAFHAAANVALFGGGDVAYIKSCAEEARKLFEAAGDAAGVARALLDLGNATGLEGDYELAGRLLKRARTAAGDVGDRLYVASATNSLAEIALRRRDYEEALALYREALALARDLGHPQSISQVLFNVGFAFFRLGRHDDAETSVKESLTLAHGLGSRHIIAACISLTGSLAAARGRPQQARRLLAMAEALQSELGASQWDPEQELHDETVASVRERIDPDQLAQAQAAGKAMPVDEAVIYTLQCLEMGQTPHTPGRQSATIGPQM